MRQGVQYTLGDFQLRLGKVLQRPNDAFVGLIVELDYLPLAGPALADPLLDVGALMPHAGMDSHCGLPKVPSGPAGPADRLAVPLLLLQCQHAEKVAAATSAHPSHAAACVR